LTINDRYNLQNENKESVKSKIDYKYFFCIIRKKVDKNFSVFLKRKKKDIEKMGLYFILAFICKTVMVWPGANNQF
jgi:hypothetical protein